MPQLMLLFCLSCCRELPASHQVEQQVFISRGITSDPHADRFATDLRQRLGQLHIDVAGPHQLQLGDRSAFFEQEASRSKVQMIRHGCCRPLRETSELPDIGCAARQTYGPV